MGKIGRRPGNRRSLRLLIAGAMLSSAAAAGALLTTHAGAELPPAFVGTAAASGGRGSFVVPGQFAVEEIVDGGGPLAPSKLDRPGGDSFAPPPHPRGPAAAHHGPFPAAPRVQSPLAYSP